MKRALKIIVPLLLAFAVIFSIGWYLIKYDPDFTRDMLVSQARSFEEQGSHTIATWLYKLAYQQSGNDETVAIELADQYRSMGNYTKAEYTLSNAIADGGTVELYIALCSTYVEQDKLLDAVAMLDNVAAPSIKQQLDALRPQAVTASPGHGYYNEYISVSLSVPDGIIYATTDGTYPSIKGSACSAPIALPAGETVIHALNVGENGLVSPLTVLSYTITGVIEEVTLTDPAIDSAVRQVLLVDDDHTLYSNELWNVTSLTVPQDAESLSDLSKLPFLTSVTIHGSQLDSLSQLASLSMLEELIITDSAVSADDLQVIGALPNLTRLTLSGCGVSSISALSSAVKLTYLDLSSNTIRDLTPLESLGQLTYLSLSHNAVTELDSLSGLTQLNALDLSYNAIVSSAPLSGCKELHILDLTSNRLTVLEGLDQLPQLQALSVAFNQLTEVNLLAANASLSVLDISNNSITDITALHTLNALENLNFSYNQVTQLPAFSKDCALVSIKGSQNQLTSINELAGLESLNYVMMDYNADLKSIGALSTCYALVEVSVYGTKVTDAAALKDMDIIVKYAPFMG